MPIARTMGTTVPYTATGTGSGLVLLHGTSLDAETNWGHLVDRFTDQRRVVVPDYAAVIRDAGEAPVDVVGYSMGAVVAAATAAAHPELVRRLVLIAGWVNSDDARFQLAFDTSTN